jgi:NTP pyrophosphatase (non-canonical NTP hydrolase)
MITTHKTINEKGSFTQTYKEFTRTTALYPQEEAINYLVLGLASEAGEVAGKLKKAIRDGHGHTELRDNIISETSDVVWYVVRLLDELELDIEDVMEYNIQKLTSRQERGVLKGSGDNR